MAVTESPFDARRHQALALRAQGYGYVRIGRALGITTTTARCLVKPGYAEHLRQLSNAAKRRRTGICEECGAQTRYHGHRDTPVARLCAACGSAKGGQIRREATLGRGPTQAKVFAYLGDGERGFMDISRECGLSPNHLGGLMNRLVAYGLVERVGRGRYRMARS